MAEEVRLWRVKSDNTLHELPCNRPTLEERIETWIAQDISTIHRNLLVIGRQVPTDFGGWIDLICIDPVGDLFIIELKRDLTPREVTAQALDYASWVRDLSRDHIAAIAKAQLGEPLEEAFLSRFRTNLPDVVNESHHILIVASEIDPSTERIISYLSEEYGVSINAITFKYFQDGHGDEFLARTFLVEPSAIESHARTKGQSKRRRNLSSEELHRLASEAGVNELYDALLNGFPRRARRGTTASSRAFNMVIDGRDLVVFSLWPGRSAPEKGLYFEAYLPRLCQITGASAEVVKSSLPKDCEDWKYDSAGEAKDMYGFKGFFRTLDEVRQFLSLFGSANNRGNQSSFMSA